MTGFDATFLSETTPLPGFTGAADDDTRRIDGTPWLDYAHFSLALSRERRMARVVAWNIDGPTIVSGDTISRAGIPFRLDPRVPADGQWGDELYARNDLDRGHVARRADLLWGEAAAQANRDSFFFTNITPQMNDFNQASRGGLWGRLEDDLLALATLDRQRISVFGGPLFTDADPAYRGAAIPTAFWKMFVYSLSGRPRAQAFLLRQSLDDLGPGAFPDERWRTYRYPLARLTAATGVDFSAYAGWEAPTDAGAVGIPPLLRPLQSVRW
ncbi:DNA/RNA non-specific endonuclease [Microbacterium sp. W1N]|uniref:DNA/RNA non-specific endonuclease n=1 Tax=Microbacterium festucae TaxID=2977531 RepID=UPI0021C10F9F|nr:DNA/RNA non-specific endonuclease [Microbacterium festucae]MCT9820822.1 DNA/RNA non-specific endonuclease [Microbacterium festucae]